MGEEPLAAQEGDVMPRWPHGGDLEAVGALREGDRGWASIIRIV